MYKDREKGRMAEIVDKITRTALPIRNKIRRINIVPNHRKTQIPISNIQLRKRGRFSQLLRRATHRFPRTELKPGMSKWARQRSPISQILPICLSQLHVSTSIIKSRKLPMLTHDSRGCGCVCGGESVSKSTEQSDILENPMFDIDDLQFHALS